MSPRTSDQNEKIKLERRRQILDAALKVIAEVGFTSASVARIAQEAAVSKGLLYNYFSSKDEMVKAIMLEGFERMVEGFDPNNDGVLTADEMRSFINGSMNTLQSNVEYWRMYFMVLMQPDVHQLIAPEMEQVLVPVMTTATTFFANRGADDPEVEMRLFTAMLDGVGMHYVLDPENYPLERVKNKLLNFLGL